MVLIQPKACTLGFILYTKREGEYNKEIPPELKDLLSHITEEEQGKVIDMIKIIKR